MKKNCVLMVVCVLNMVVCVLNVSNIEIYAQEEQELTLQESIQRNIKHIEEALQKSGIPDTLQEYVQKIKEFPESNETKAFLQQKKEDANKILQEISTVLQNELEKLNQYLENNETKEKIESELKSINDSLRSLIEL